MNGCSNAGRGHAGKGIENEVANVGQRKNESFDETDWKLTGMPRLLRMVAFNVGNLPKVFWIFSQRIAR